MTALPRPVSGLSNLAAEPEVLTGVLVGYGRVSTSEQLLDRQLRALTDAGCGRVFTDQLSGRDTDRPQLRACLGYLRPGDTLVVASLDRLSRSLQDLITLVADLRRRGIGFRSLHEALDTTTPGGRLVFHVFAALAEFIRELIVEGTKEGLEAARARGVRLGRPPAMTPEQVGHARQLLTNPDNTVSSIAKLLGVSRSTIYKYLPELAAPRTLTPADPGRESPPPVVEPTPPPRTYGAPCPGCGYQPAQPQELRRHRRDLAERWLYPSPTGGVRERRHCSSCQPHDLPVAVLVCALCGNGPILAEDLATAFTAGDLTAPLRDWLRRHRWRGSAPAQLVCPDHPAPRPGR